MLIYETGSVVRNAVTLDFSKWKSESVVRQYMKHYENLMFLQFMAIKGTMSERSDAEREIPICKRKMAFWERHHAFDKDLARRSVESATSAWRGR